MADPIVPDALPAASSAAPIETHAPDAASDWLDTATDAQIHDWRMTGKQADRAPAADPDDQATTAGTPPAPAVEDQPASTDASPEPASEPATPPIKAKTQARIDEVLADRAKERERADRAERRLAEIERRPPTQPDARPAASSAAPTELVKPNPETYPYGTADPEYLEALTDYKVAASLAGERATWEAGQARERLADEGRRLATAFEAKAAVERAIHPDFDDVALKAPTDIPQGSPVDLYILESPAGLKILYHLQQPANRAETQRILGLGALEQLSELVRLGDRLSAPESAPRSTRAPAPPPTLASRATPADPVARAIADDDTAAYNAAMNRRELAKLNGK